MKQTQRIRRELHHIPELDHQLPKTIAYIKQFLTGMQCRIFQPIPSAVCAYFDFNQSSTVAYRSDMDALAIQESNNISYCSKHMGQMHACGHDAHMAILLSFADYLNRRKNAKHNVLLIFQPAEETTGGAKEIVETGLFAKFRVAALFGIHVKPGIKKGNIASKSGYMMAKSAEITVDIKGKAVHIAQYSNGRDALWTACCFIQRLYEISNAYPNKDHLVKFGFCQSGQVCNALSDHTVLKGSLRVFADNDFCFFRQRMISLGEQLQKENGCEFTFHLSEGYPALYNDECLFEQARSLIPDMIALSKPDLLSEDFAYYGKAVKSLFFYLGIGDAPSLHSDHFDFDDSCLIEGVNIYRKLLAIDI